MRTHVLVTFITGHCGRLACLALCLLATAPGGAQVTAQTATQIETGLLSFFSGANRSVKVTVTELGARTVQSQVRIVFFDATDRIVGRHDGVLVRGRPVSFEVPLGTSDPQVQLRASVLLVGATGRRTTPVVVLEDVDADSLTIGQRVTCAPPASREGPVTPFCPGTVISSFTIGG